MKYKPSRDIQKACRELKTVSPTEISKWIQEHRTEEDPKTKKRVQVYRTPQSISMWFRENPATHEELKTEIEDRELDAIVISETIFQNGAFRKIPCIEQMEIEMRGRGAKDESINANLRMIKRICMGQLPQTKEQMKNGESPIIIESWGLKHPRRLTLADFLKFNSEMIKAKVGGRGWRLAMRCFMESKGMKGKGKLSGKYHGAGKYAHLYAPPEKKNAIFAWLKRMNKEAHDACYFSFKTGARSGATFSAESKYVDPSTQTIYVFEKASKHGEKRKLKKWMPPDLWDIIEPRIKNGGQLFNISEQEVSDLLKACYQQIIPELANDIPMPFHFWRHQFAQYGLRSTGWNTSLIAKLGGWTVGTLERYYGKMDEQTAFKEAEKFLSSI